MHCHFMKTIKIFKNTYINFWPYYMGHNRKKKDCELEKGQFKGKKENSFFCQFFPGYKGQFFAS